MHDLHTIIKNNELADAKAKTDRIALIKRELAKLDNGEFKKILSDLVGKV